MIHALLGMGLCASVLAGPPRGDGYLVLVEPGEGGQFRAAAEAMAGLHGGKVVEVDFGELVGVERVLGGERPRWVALVMPPERIDVELSRRVLEMSARVDDDPFVDFEYGFVTGRDGAAAAEFVGRIAAGWEREWGRKSAFFGSWEGAALPPMKKLTAMEAMGLEATGSFVLMKDEEGKRVAAARTAMEGMGGRDSLLFFSHGYPGEMVGCYTGAQLREWGIDLSPAVVFNSSCYNGAPGRWWKPGAVDGRMALVEQEPVAAEESAALALLDSGVTGAFLGVDPWHGPLTCQVFALAVDDGLTLGGAAKRMFDRLAMEFVPGRIEFAPVAERRVFGEGVENRRSNGAGMILYGDPAMRICGDGGEGGREGLMSSAVEEVEGGLRVRITVKPMVSGMVGPDGMVPMWRLGNYYSVRTGDVMKEMAPELYQVVELPRGFGAGLGAGDELALRVVSAKVGPADLPTGEVRGVVEAWHGGVRRLHIRVPVEVRMLGTPWVEQMMRVGVEVVLEMEAEGE